MFLLSVFTQPQGSLAEKFLFENCFIKELKSFQKGNIMFVRGKKLFVQVRVIQHCMDTKAIGKELHVQECNSLIGCPLCRGFHGSSRDFLSKVTYGGNRKALPIDHILRYIGESQRCCPPNFYNTMETQEEINIATMNFSSIQNKIKNALDSIDTGIGKENKIESKRLVKIRNEIVSCIYNNTNEHNLQIANLYCSAQPRFEWFHENDQYAFQNFHHDALYFMHCDLRPQLKINRRTHQEFNNDGILAHNSLNNSIVNGVKDVWLMAQLFYADVKFDLNFDGFHCLYGVCKQIHKLFKGNLKSKNGPRKSIKLSNFCKKNKIFPFLWTKWSRKNKTWETNAYNPPWVLTEKEQNKVDAWLNAVLIPQTFSNHFQLKNVFKHSGFLRGNSYIVLFAVAINYLIIALPENLEKPYKTLISMLGNDISELISPSLSSEDIKKIENQIIETVCVIEGMFSERENTFLVHEMLHLASHIFVMGPLQGWWTLSGERAMGFVKQFVKKGGRSFEKHMMTKYDQFENAITEKAFTSLLLEDDEEINYLLSFNGSDLEYDNNRFLLLENSIVRSTTINFSTVECNYFLQCLLDEVIKACPEVDDALKKSSFFRLHSCYQNILLETKNKSFQFENKSITSFLHFLFLLNSRIQREDNDIFHIKDIDLMTAKTICHFLQYKKGFIIYKKALIFGERFTARGAEYVENEDAKESFRNYGQQEKYFEMNNNLNDLNKLENWSSQYSSWCRYRVSQYEPKLLYGQLNYFFRFYCSTDNILHGLPMANLVPRNYIGSYTASNPYGVDKIMCQTKFQKNKRNFFVPLTNIFPSAILLAPFDSDHFPIYIKEDIIKEDMVYYSKNNIISYFIAFDLHPNRKYSVFDPMKIERYNRFSKYELDELVKNINNDNDE
jgi:hypothetical protein